jgi:hypothetical protein
MNCIILILVVKIKLKKLKYNRNSLKKKDKPVEFLFTEMSYETNFDETFNTNNQWCRITGEYHRLPFLTPYSKNNNTSRCINLAEYVKLLKMITMGLFRNAKMKICYKIVKSLKSTKFEIEFNVS